MASENPWERWGIVRSTRDGYPVLTETLLWHLMAHHPEVVERAGESELYVHLDQPYRVVKMPDRDWRILLPVPGRPAPGHGRPSS
jgi:hypothetical protein